MAWSDAARAAAKEARVRRRGLYATKEGAIKGFWRVVGPHGTLKITKTKLGAAEELKASYRDAVRRALSERAFARRKR